MQLKIETVKNKRKYIYPFFDPQLLYTTNVLNKKSSGISQNFFMNNVVLDSYFCRYITSFTNLTVPATLGNAPVTKLGA